MSFVSCLYVFIAYLIIYVDTIFFIIVWGIKGYKILYKIGFHSYEILMSSRSIGELNAILNM